jgi:hypothetical protein
MSLSRFVTFKEPPTSQPTKKRSKKTTQTIVKEKQNVPQPFVEDDAIVTNAIDFKVESKDENDSFLKSDKKWSRDVKKAIAKKTTPKKKKHESSDEESDDDESDGDTDATSETCEDIIDETRDIDDTEDEIVDASLEYVDDYCNAGYDSENEFFHPLFSKKDVEPKIKEYKIRVVACDDFDF